jgi:hypothetical protein
VTGIRCARRLARPALGLLAALALLLSADTPARADGATTWTATQLTLSGGGQFGMPLAVSCPSPGECVTVGSVSAYEGSTVDGFASAAIESAGAWSTFGPIDPTAPPRGWSGLSAVSCWAVRSCLAVGRDPKGFIAYELSGSVWTKLVYPTMPSRHPPFSDPSVSCVAGTCWVLGGVSFAPRGHTVRAFVATLAGSAWSVASFRVPPNVVHLGSITCFAVARCAALVDTGREGSAFTVPIRSYVDWMGPTGWHRSFPAGWGSFSALSLNCPTSTTCAATGQLKSGKFVVSLQPHGWGSSITPDGDSPVTATCESATCVVPAYPKTPLNYGHGPGLSTEIWSLTASTWTGPSNPPVPTGVLNMNFDDVSCVAGACVLSGYGAVDFGGGYVPMPLVVTSG